MMDYEMFKSVVTERIREVLPPTYRNYEPQIHKVRKVNEEKECFTMMPPKNSGIVSAPNIYLDNMYEQYMECQDIDQILFGIALTIINYTGHISADDADINFERMKEFIVMNLINTERNRDLLETVPHREILDLSIVYRIIINQTEYGLNTLLVTDEIMKEMSVSADELHELAYRNTLEMFPVEITSFSESFYFMSNSIRLHGASTMVCEEFMAKLADEIGGDFYVIPSSIHEIIAVPYDKDKLSRLKKTLECGNRQCNNENEILSGSVYFYEFKTRTLSIAGAD